MRHRSVSLVLLALAALAGGCVESRHPLADPDTARADSDLYGIWTRTSGKDTEMLIIGKYLVKGHPNGFMRFHEVSYSGSSATYSHSSDRYFIASTIGGSGYISILRDSLMTDPATRVPINLDQEHHYERWKVHADRTFFFQKYQVVGNTLTVWYTDTKSVGKLVEDGQIAGKVSKTKEGDITSVTLTDSTENLANFIRNGGDSKLFAARTRKVYTRFR
jgi:hypothetical protein